MPLPDQGRLIDRLRDDRRMTALVVVDGIG
jgi:hypothetical protein